MSDDLAAILRSIGTTQANILKRLDALERGAQTQEATEAPVPANYGRSSPTSPPSLKLSVRHGRIWTFDPNTFHNTFSDAWEDFNLELSLSAFTNAYYYRAVVPFLCTNYSMPDLFKTEEVGVGEEFETFEECQAWFEAKLYASDVKPYYSGYAVFPLCALAIRNNGTTGVVNQYYPITLSDRQQSSFIYRDLRPWMAVVNMRP